MNQQPMSNPQPAVSKWLWITLIIVILIAGGFFAWYYLMGPGKVVQTSSSTAMTTANSTKEKNLEPIIIYSKEISTADTNERRWPTIKIYMKTGDSAPVELATVGKVNEYPGDFLLSPDKKSLLISFETKLQIINLQTKTLEDLFTPKKQVGNVAYSPDGKSLFIWDQVYASKDNDKSYIVHKFDIVTKKDNIIKEGSLTDDPFFLAPVGWRDDNYVVLAAPAGEVSTPYYYNLATNEFKKLSNAGNDMMRDRLSNSYKYFASSEKNVEDICNDFSGSANSTYKIVDTVSGQLVGTVGATDEAATVVAFSPKDDEILYYTTKPWTDKKDCETKAAKTFYRQKISTNNQPQKVDDVQTLLKSWNVNSVNASLTSKDGKVWAIKIDDKIVVNTEENLSTSVTLIAQYYQSK